MQSGHRQFYRYYLLNIEEIDVLIYLVSNFLYRLNFIPLKFLEIIDSNIDPQVENIYPAYCIFLSHEKVD